MSTLKPFIPATISNPGDEDIRRQVHVIFAILYNEDELKNPEDKLFQRMVTSRTKEESVKGSVMADRYGVAEAIGDYAKSTGEYPAAAAADWETLKRHSNSAAKKSGVSRTQIADAEEKWLAIQAREAQVNSPFHRNEETLAG